MTDHEFAPVDPFALQQNEVVRVCTAAGDQTTLQGVVALVDTKNLYVSVLFDGTQYPVALPMPDWVFQTEVDAAFVPTADGLYIDDDEPEQASAQIFRLRDGEWTDLLTGESVSPDELPNLAPLRAFSPGQNFQPPPAAEPTPEEQPAEDPAAEQPITTEGDPA